MSVPDIMGIHPVVLETFQSEPKCLLQGNKAEVTCLSLVDIVFLWDSEDDQYVPKLHDQLCFSLWSCDKQKNRRGTKQQLVFSLGQQRVEVPCSRAACWSHVPRDSNHWQFNIHLCLCDWSKLFLFLLQLENIVLIFKVRNRMLPSKWPQMTRNVNCKQLSHVVKKNHVPLPPSAVRFEVLVKSLILLPSENH